MKFVDTSSPTWYDFDMDNNNNNIGVRVIHPGFGWGRTIDVGTSTAVVRFDRYGVLRVRLELLEVAW